MLLKMYKVLYKFIRMPNNFILSLVLIIHFRMFTRLNIGFAKGLRIINSISVLTKIIFVCCLKLLFVYLSNSTNHDPYSEVESILIKATTLLFQYKKLMFNDIGINIFCGILHSDFFNKDPESIPANYWNCSDN